VGDGVLDVRYFIPEGVDDIHYDEYEIKENLISKMKSLYKSYGYRQVLTPTFEYYDMFSSIEGTISRDEMFKFIDGSGKILVLRPDATVPIARMVASNYRKNNGYLKFCYVTNVFRTCNSKNGYKKEFIQAGAEYFGNKTPEGDGEIIALAVESLKKFGIKDFKIDIGQAGFFKGILRELNLAEEFENQVKKLIENKNFAELNNVIADLNITDELKNTLFKIPYLYGEPENVIEEAMEIVLNNEMEKALNNLKKVYEILKDYGFEKYVSVDLGLINHLDYYTGIVFKGYVSNHGKEVLSGGRYDNLTKQYGYYMPATGFGLNIDELMEVVNMYEINNNSVGTDFLILYSEENRQEAFSLAYELRDKGYIVECDTSGDIVRHIKNAESRNVKEILRVADNGISVINVGDNGTFKMRTNQFLSSLNDREVVVPIH
jgi:ATP phosphoribosyltransferase regulatory subunit